MTVPEHDFNGILTPDCDPDIRRLEYERIRLRKWLVELLERARATLRTEDTLTATDVAIMCEIALRTGDTPISSQYR